MYVDIHGDAYPCCVFAGKALEKTAPPLCMGNVRTQTLKEIWDSPRFTGFREKFFRGEFPHVICEKCPKFSGN